MREKATITVSNDSDGIVTIHFSGKVASVSGRVLERSEMVLSDRCVERLSPIISIIIMYYLRLRPAAAGDSDGGGSHRKELIFAHGASHYTPIFQR